ncbi:rpl34 (nucleomorph) [Hemiselmis andersenii]|uniref:Rpl34 n=1 Tax=Hemiselmis andersenii TaxID=464988 RepID=A9BKX4_HEMAN|nr:rpl34 [Hemiselmis andersenii]ABW98129.1 rpl34 [Hemiselmis andersenii]
MKDRRVVLRRHCPFSTRKNSFKKVKTPGNKIKIQYLDKKISKVVCAESKKKLNGISSPQSLGFMRLCKRKKKISRIYGGHLSGNSTKERIIKSFLLDEKKLVKKYNKEKKKPFL